MDTDEQGYKGLQQQLQLSYIKKQNAKEEYIRCTRIIIQRIYDSHLLGHTQMEQPYKTGWPLFLKSVVAVIV